MNSTNLIKTSLACALTLCMAWFASSAFAGQRDATCSGSCTLALGMASPKSSVMVIVQKGDKVMQVHEMSCNGACTLSLGMASPGSSVIAIVKQGDKVMQVREMSCRGTCTLTLGMTQAASIAQQQKTAMEKH